MTIKGLINGVVGVTGYQFSRRPSIARDVRAGKYRWLQERGIATVLDIGANAGQFASLIRQILPQAQIYAFEPLEDCFRELQAAAASLEPIRCFHYALGKRNAVETIRRSDFSPSSSFLPMTDRHRDAFPMSRNVVEQRVEVKTLDFVAPELTLTPKVLAKVDVQGYELSVLAGAAKTIPRVSVFIIECSFVELYKRQPLFHDIYRFMTDRHFRYVGNLDQLLDPSTGGVLQVDAMFEHMRTRGR